MKQACIRCVVRLVPGFRFGQSESQILPPALDPRGYPKRGRITYKLPTLSPLLLPARVASTGRLAMQEKGRFSPLGQPAGGKPVCARAACSAVPRTPTLLLPSDRPASAPRSAQRRALALVRHPGTGAPALAGVWVCRTLPWGRAE